MLLGCDGGPNVARIHASYSRGGATLLSHHATQPNPGDRRCAVTLRFRVSVTEPSITDELYGCMHVQRPRENSKEGVHTDENCALNNQALQGPLSVPWGEVSMMGCLCSRTVNCTRKPVATHPNLQKYHDPNTHACTPSAITAAKVIMGHLIQCTLERNAIRVHAALDTSTRELLVQAHSTACTQ